MPTKQKKQPKQKVVLIEVYGGVASVKKCPKSVKVIIDDQDEREYESWLREALKDD